MKSSRKNMLTGFTLIELLIVVAIIAILAAIAVPNFLEAQTRAKVSRVRADMRSIATGLETYMIDNNQYVYMNRLSRALAIGGVNTPTLERLTTPIAYMSSMSFKTPFRTTIMINGNKLNNTHSITGEENLQNSQYYWYSARNAGEDGEGAAIWRAGTPDPKPHWYFTQSSGPAGVCYQTNGAINKMTADNAAHQDTSNKVVYNPTNGTVSSGAIWRVGGSPTPMGKSFYNALQAGNSL